MFSSKIQLVWGDSSPAYAVSILAIFWINKPIKKRLDLYLAAEAQILTGAQSYTIGSRQLTRADLSMIRKIIDDLSTQLEVAELKNGKQRRAVFVD